MIEFQKLNKKFGSRRVLSDISAVCSRTGITGIIGPNSCGKSTLIKCLLGLVVPDSGEILCDGQPISSGDGHSYRSRLGYLSQNVNFPENLTVGETLELLERLRGQPAVKKKTLLERLGLGPTLKQPFGQLSGGTRQKVGAVGALMFDPEMLILDEPTASLDLLAALEMRKLIEEERQQGKTVLLVSHFFEELETLADHLIFLLEGRVEYQGPIQEFMTSCATDKLDRAVITHLLRTGRTAQ